MKKQYNILQYEFFHVGGGNTSSLKEVMSQCSEYIADNSSTAMFGHDTGPGIKTVVRIYDIDGLVTCWVKLVKDLEVQRQAYINTPWWNNRIANWFAHWLLRRLSRKIERMRALIVRYFIEYIGLSFKVEWSVARETCNHAFRPARREEYIELHQAAIRAKDFWLFIFEPNDLLADRNEVIVSVV